ncbi:VOC family protein [Bacillus sp. XF8]|uniref:VOC family protein n=1 Tax=Bacillus sp. XF8 TaxID=2819289 RepID=UPI001AA02AAC|nr:VOC family protein [Bacillus sp. XF8]MBO1582238.1 lactoylglutathione lyase [Bacillus sp. XF8]
METITNCIVLEVRNLKDTLYFYEGVLGFQPSRHRPQLHVPGVWYDIDSTRICFILNKKKGENFSREMPSSIKFSLPLCDMEKVRKKLEFYCVSFEELESCKTEKRGIAVHDPDQYKILIESRE